MQALSEQLKIFFQIKLNLAFQANRSDSFIPKIRVWLEIVSRFN